MHHILGRERYVAGKQVEERDSDGMPQRVLAVSTRMALGRRLTGEDGRRVQALEVRIEDNGPGIEPGVLERLATPFFTTRAEGHGLGLAVARHWAMMHGGTLKIESRPGEGTSVRVVLPLNRADRVPARSAATSSDRAAGEPS